jgi:phosphatidylserine/phosphatidylglycerophosphate/cardiolipin synthase-like enzyme
VRALLAAAMTATVVCACGPAALAASSEAPPDPPLGPAHTVRIGGDVVTLLRGGDASFARIRALIDGARESVHLEMYEFNRADLVDAIVDVHARRVPVTVIDDPSEESSAATDLRLRLAGVDVVDYPVRKLMIDHVKLLVVDASVAVVGGINWGVASAANHDYDALLRGPVVHNLDRVFIRDLVTCGRALTVPDPLRDPAIVVAATLPAAEIRPLVLDLVNSARRSIDVELFDLTDTTVVRALVAAHLRGVRVRVLLDPGQGSSVPAAATLLGLGIEVRFYRTRGELLHAKAMVTDSQRLIFGSANWSGGGFARNHEVDIELPQAAAVAAQMEEQMRLDWSAAVGL